MAKSKRTKQFVMEQRTMTEDDLEKMRVACIWEGCDRSIPSTEMQPPDWHNLLVYWSPYPDAKKTLAEILLRPILLPRCRIMSRACEGTRRASQGHRAGSSRTAGRLGIILPGAGKPR